LGLLAAMMLVASPVLAWQPGPNEGNKYSKNYYPNTYFTYCEPDGSKYYGDTKASKNSWCDKYYKESRRRPSTASSTTTSMSTTSGRPRTATRTSGTTGITASTTSTMTRTTASPISRPGSATNPLAITIGSLSTTGRVLTTNNTGPPRVVLPTRAPIPQGCVL
jgi:hypothetical protein